MGKIRWVTTHSMRQWLQINILSPLTFHLLYWIPQNFSLYHSICKAKHIIDFSLPSPFILSTTHSLLSSCVNHSIQVQIFAMFRHSNAWWSQTNRVRTDFSRLKNPTINTMIASGRQTKRWLTKFFAFVCVCVGILFCIVFRQNEMRRRKKVMPWYDNEFRFSQPITFSSINKQKRKKSHLVGSKLSHQAIYQLSNAVFSFFSVSIKCLRFFGYSEVSTKRNNLSTKTDKYKTIKIKLTHSPLGSFVTYFRCVIQSQFHTVRIVFKLRMTVNVCCGSNHSMSFVYVFSISYSPCFDYEVSGATAQTDVAHRNDANTGHNSLCLWVTLPYLGSSASHEWNENTHYKMEMIITNYR